MTAYLQASTAIMEQAVTSTHMAKIQVKGGAQNTVRL